MKLNPKLWQERLTHLKLCCLENLKKHVPLKPYKERWGSTLSSFLPIRVQLQLGQRLAFLNISEESVEVLKDF